MTDDPETVLENMSLEDRVRAVRDDIDSGARNFADIDVFRLAELLEVPQPEMPENSWRFCTAVYISSVEEWLRDYPFEWVNDMCYWLEATSTGKERLDELRTQGAIAMSHDEPSFDFLSASEREYLEKKAATEELDRLVGNGVGGDATYHVCVGGVSLWFRGAIEDDATCIDLEGPYDGIDGPDNRHLDGAYLCDTW